MYKFNYERVSGRPVYLAVGKVEDVPMQTSGSAPDSSMGILATRSIHSWMRLVTWGTTWTVLPK